MTKKITTEEYISRCIATHGQEKYNYSNTVYKTAKEKVEIFCNTCQKVFHQTAFEHANNGQGCPTCGVAKRNNAQRMTKDEFVSRAEVVHGSNLYDYADSVYISSHKKLSIKCNKHEHIFLQSPANHLLGKTGCVYCEREKLSESNRDSTKDFVEKATSVFGSRFNYSFVEYKNSSTKVNIGCVKHGINFYQTPNSHLSGKVGCRLCQTEAASKPLKSKEDFIKKSIEVHGEGIFDYSKVEYLGAHVKVLLFCNKHSIWFKQTPARHYNSVGCPICFREHKLKSHPNKITDDEFISRSKEIFGDFYGYSLVDLSGGRNNRKVKLVCPEHGVFEQDIHSHLSGVRGGCCVGRNKTTDAFIEQVIRKHGDVFDFSETEYKGSKVSVILTCKVCNNRFNANPGSLLQGHACPACADYGFNASKPAMLYVHSVVGKYHEFTGFGITRNIASRTRNHTKNLNREGYSIVNSFTTEKLDGKFIQQLEKALKDTFPLDTNTSHIEGFKTESTIESYQNVCDFVRNYIENNKETAYGND